MPSLLAPAFPSVAVRAVWACMSGIAQTLRGDRSGCLVLYLVAQLGCAVGGIFPLHLGIQAGFFAVSSCISLLEWTSRVVCSSCGVQVCFLEII